MAPTHRGRSVPSPPDHQPHAPLPRHRL